MTRIAPAAFFDEMRQLYTRSAHKHGEICVRIIIAGVRVEQRYASRALYTRFSHALAHLPSFDGDPDFTAFYYEQDPFPPLPWKYEPDLYTDDYGAQGEIRGFNDDRFGLMHTQWFHEFTFFDRERRECLFMVRDEHALPYWYSAFPLRHALQLWSRDHDFQVMHGAAVGTPEGGVLIAGASGSGKSTTTLACLTTPDLYIAGDDNIAVSGIGGDQPLTVHSLYSVVKLVPSPMINFPDFLPFTINPNFGDHEKRMISLHQAAPHRLITAFPLRAIFIPRISGQPETTLTPANRAHALWALAPASIFQMGALKHSTYAKIARLVRDLPVFTLHVGTTIETIPDAIMRYLERISQPQVTI
jgi:hypothetical protein